MYVKCLLHNNAQILIWRNWWSDNVAGERGKDFLRFLQLNSGEILPPSHQQELSSSLFSSGVESENWIIKEKLITSLSWDWDYNTA